MHSKYTSQREEVAIQEFKSMGTIRTTILKSGWIG